MSRPSKGTLKELRPDIAKQLLHPELASELSVGSRSVVEWKCSNGHVWKAKVYNRTGKKPTGCPYCDGKKILKGFNDLATTNPEVVDLLLDKEDAYKYAAKSNKKVFWKCGRGHIWEAPVSRITVQKSGCPYCSGRLPIIGETDLGTTNPDIAKELVDKSLSTQLKATSNKKVFWKCKHGHEYKTSPISRISKGNGCPYCSGRNAIVGETDLATTHPKLAAELVDKSLAMKLKAYSEKKVEWRCKNDPSHTWYSTVGNRVLHDSGCPICSNHKIIKGVNDLATTHPEFAEKLVNIEDAYLVSYGSGKKLLWKCSQGHEYEATVYSQCSGGLGCPECAKHNRSNFEISVFDVVNQLFDGEVKHNVHGVLPSNYELDIYIPAIAVAIECNGCYWHSEACLENNHLHQQKFAWCAEQGIQLIQIWEDDWNEKREICIEMLAAKIQSLKNLNRVLTGVNPARFERVFARKLTPCVLKGWEASDFHNMNHIQGAVTSTYHFGLKDEKGEVKAVMSVRSATNGLRMNRKQGEWDIQRYSSIGLVVGGFTKLVKFAENYIKSDGKIINHWYSFSANDVSDGSLYEKNGFVCDKELDADYKYADASNNFKRMSKESFQKKRFREDDSLIYQDGLTEHELARLNGLFRIYDAGKKRWVKEVL